MVQKAEVDEAISVSRCVPSKARFERIVTRLPKSHANDSEITDPAHARASGKVIGLLQDLQWRPVTLVRVEASQVPAGSTVLAAGEDGQAFMDLLNRPGFVGDS